jgi:hypothetical protein
MISLSRDNLLIRAPEFPPAIAFFEGLPIAEHALINPAETLRE